MTTVSKNNAKNTVNKHKKMLCSSLEGRTLQLYIWRSVDYVAASLLDVYAVVDSVLDSWLMPLVQSLH